MSRKPAATKSSSKEKEPSPPSTFHETTVLADTTNISGIHNVYVGANTVIHPRVNILTYSAPVRIGRHCLISDLSTIGICTPTFNPKNKRASHAVIIDSHVIIEPGCVVEGCVGEGTILEAGAKVGRGASVGSYCRVAARGVVAEGEFVGDGEVVLGGGLGKRTEAFTEFGRDLRFLIGVRRGECEMALLKKSGRTITIVDGLTDEDKS
ncbi:hypothetical protein FGG08_001314 [Glutinoglossum americanum]|uniref:Dynactin subunit 6 n=1 Tax=Glutinoglossum americanum TaxID=1670608 RepID=A0A9P8L6B2_9PEZI|nr:hypothetical protein FGG08_001314 [Glutinoglossum americanum]